MQEKSENFNSLRPILFELCKKKPAGIGFKSHPLCWVTLKFKERPGEETALNITQEWFVGLEVVSYTMEETPYSGIFQS